MSMNALSSMGVASAGSGVPINVPSVACTFSRVNDPSAISISMKCGIAPVLVTFQIAAALAPDRKSRCSDRRG